MRVNIGESPTCMYLTKTVASKPMALPLVLRGVTSDVRMMYILYLQMTRMYIDVVEVVNTLSINVYCGIEQFVNST